MKGDPLSEHCEALAGLYHEPMRTSSARWLAALGIILALLISGSWLLGVGTYRMMSLPRLFSSQLWKGAKNGAVDGSNDVRCRMVLDLRTRVGLAGRSQAEVLQLLGDERENPTKPPETYILCPSLADYYVLKLTWANGKVISTRVYQS